jgi:selenide, water dikinase
MEHAEDAGVYQLTEDLAIVLSLDFFTPIVDDPYTFGQIAAANSLSDIYAMGGVPITAMNIICFPIKTMDISILQEVLRGGLDKMREAGVPLVGGHSVEDNEFKYGLSVTGTIHPQKIIYNRGARVGDKLILTKPLGTGIINTALKGGLADENSVAEAISCMSSLNRKAAELMAKVKVNACTDVTGFGLLGHACEMIKGEDVGMILYSSAIPILPGTEDYAMMGLIPAGTIRNRDYSLHMIRRSAGITDERLLILFDAQTSGGLLISVPAPQSHSLLEMLHREGVKEAAIIGEIVAQPKGIIAIT